MNKEPLISIIIPVFNADEYLGGCLDAILERQKFDDFEVILIDDGSTDSSPRMCDGYAGRSGNVRAIHKPNGGASSARNAGLREAAGKYILFIDADDYIADFSLERIAALIENEGEADLVLLNTVNIYPDGSAKQRERFDKARFYKQEHAAVLKNISKYLPDCVWGKLIKREVIMQNDIFFIEGIICEDVDFCIKLFMHARSYNAADFDYYYYRDGREGSVMNTYPKKAFTGLLFVVTRWDNLAKRSYKEHTAVLRGWIFNNYCWALLTRYRKLTKEEKAAYKHEMKSLRHILNYSGEAGAALVRAGYRLFGIDAASRIAAIYAYVFIWKALKINNLFFQRNGKTLKGGKSD